MGNAAAGEWLEWGEQAVHLRRRLSANEERLTGPAIDVRGTQEFEVRMSRVRAVYPWAPGA